jgi:putative glycosyltransferase (TIGR04348 family)
MNVAILTPAPPGSLHGNRVTALRWAKRLRELGHRVRIGDSIADPHAIDLLVAVHARKTAGSILFAHRARPDLPIFVCLAGTDVYGDLARPGPAAEQGYAALASASRVIALQPLAEQALPERLRVKVRTILQSACAAPGQPPEDRFEVTVIGHLRHVKDPLRVAQASRLLPATSRVSVTQLGGALSPDVAAAARNEQAENPRYHWLGQRPRRETLEHLAASHLFVLPSEAEGGANVLSEALAARVPVLCTAIPGSLGILGVDHPGAFPVGDTAALAALMSRAETDADFLEALRRRSRELAPLVTPEREREAWASLLKEIA